MKTSILFLAITARPLFATGDYYEESIPSLPVYLSYDRLPGKTLLEISRELKPEKVAEVNFRDEIQSIVSGIKGGKAPSDFLAKVNELLSKERTATHAWGNGLNAFLHDMRDVCAGKADAAAAGDYLSWRLEKGGILGFSLEETGSTERTTQDNGERDAAVEADIAKRMADAAPAMKPHYLYAKGAYAFQLGSEDEKQFAEVALQFPDHPRAEAAAYMVGRCLYQQSRVSKDSEYVNVPDKVEAAQKALEGYVAKYPRGRFVGDALGWLGGLAWNTEKPADALRYFTRQLNLPGHPEFAVPATFEIERCFRRLYDQPSELADAITDPAVAQAAVYFANNEVEPIDGNGKFETAEFVAGWRKKLLPALADALAQKADVFKEVNLQPRYVASLALAASGAGRQEQALKLLEGASPEESDDIAFARAVAFQRASRPADAVNAYRLLIEKHPSSTLARGSKIRLALALVDDHRSGEAAVVLMEADLKHHQAETNLSEPAEPTDDAQAATDAEFEQQDGEREGQTEVQSGLGSADPGQMRQLLDTLLNFAPMQELAAAAKDTSVAEELRSKLRSVLAVRHLAREQFTEAKPYLTPAQWNLAAGHLAELTTAAKAAKTASEKAATAMKLADAWAAARGRLLTVPLDTEEWLRAVFLDDHAVGNITRMENAGAFESTRAVPLDLENRDELRHAFNWWLVASDAEPKTPRTATAIWRALRAMRDIADVSPFTLERAAARKWSETSRKLHDRLKQEHPNSRETKRLAVWWTFPEGKAEDGEWHSRGLTTLRVEPVSVEYPEALGEKGNLIAEIVQGNAPKDIAALRDKVAKMKNWARLNFTLLNEQCVINFYEDLDLFLAIPGLTPELARRYIDLRYDVLCSASVGFGPPPVRPGAEKKDEPGTFRGDEALLADIRAMAADPSCASIADFVSFLEIAVVANHWVTVPLSEPGKDGQSSYWGRDYAEMERLCRAWLAKYPKSRKREAALLLHCRALRHAMEPYVYWKLATWPEASTWEGEEKRAEIPRLKFDAAVWKAALDRYDREFPKGIYADDVLGYRADLAVRMKDWKRALQISLEQRGGKEHLKPNAENRLRLIFSHFRNDNDRADLLAAVKATEGARGALQESLDGGDEWTKSALEWFHEWLTEEITQ